MLANTQAMKKFSLLCWYNLFPLLFMKVTAVKYLCDLLSLQELYLRKITMPRKYIPMKKYKEHSLQKMNEALQFIKDGGSLREADAKYGISYSVLYRRLKKGNKMKKHGGQTVLSEEEEMVFVDRLQTCGDWGYPVDPFTLRLLVKEFLDRQGKTVVKFKDNMPGRDFVYSFLKRHSKELSKRMCQNIKRYRAAVSPEILNEYFDHLQLELEDVPPQNIINYDETNLTDDPGRRLVITRRGCKYPERIMNSSKSSTSVMFAASATGEILPPYVVYKAQNLYDSWRVGGPANSRYNRTKSGWFDAFCFSHWVKSVAIPYFSKLEGKKVLIGDNLSSHLSHEEIKLCQERNICFIFLPSNSTHLTQPLDVAFFRPMKISWRAILEEWKKGPGIRESSVPKDRFPPLLKNLCSTLQSKNVLAGFRKCGIIPFNRDVVLQMLPSSSDCPSVDQNQVVSVAAVDDTFKELLKTLRHGDAPKRKKKRTKVSVVPGKSVAVTDFEIDPNIEAILVPSTSKGKRDTKNKAKKKKTVVSESTSEDSDKYSLQDSDREYILSTTSEDEPDFTSRPSTPSGGAIISPGEFVIVKVYGKTASSFQLYVSKVLEPDNNGYLAVFYKRLKQTRRFVETDEEAFISQEDVVLKLKKQEDGPSSARFKDSISFVNNLTSYILH